MIEQPSLLDVDGEHAPGTHRTGDHHTSRGAALADLGRRGNQRRRIAAAFAGAPLGLTDEEAAERAGIDLHSSPWKRCSELREFGYLEYVGVDRPTTTGSPAKVWKMTDAGRAVWNARYA